MGTTWIITNRQKILSTPEGNFPQDTVLDNIRQELKHPQTLGTLHGQDYVTLQYTGTAETIGQFAFQDLRSLFGILPLEVFVLAGKALHLNHWAMTHTYCGVCGTATLKKTDELALVCPQCQQVYYPRISPAIITAVVRDQEILLARSQTAVYKKFSLLAGFVEPGETLEETVQREVQEEVGLQVKNIRYFGSQPWPFPDTLMLGFIAEYASGELKLDPKEISEARWFTRGSLPSDIPLNHSISGKIISWWKDH